MGQSMLVGDTGSGVNGAYLMARLTEYAKADPRAAALLQRLKGLRQGKGVTREVPMTNGTGSLTPAQPPSRDFPPYGNDQPVTGGTLTPGGPPDQDFPPYPRAASRPTPPGSWLDRWKSSNPQTGLPDPALYPQNPRMARIQSLLAGSPVANIIRQRLGV